MLKKCEFDKVEFEPKRSTAKFCSDACRLKAARATRVDIGEVIETNKAMPGLQKYDDDKTYDRAKNLAAFQKMGLDSVSWISTGIADFDELTKIPRGRLTQIEGRYGVGKTTLCINMIKGLKDKKVLYIDSEASLNPDLLVSLEIEAKNFTLYNQSSFLEDISDLIRASIKSGKYEMIILDSVAMTTTRVREASDITAANIAQKAVILNKTLELIMGDLRDSKVALVFINQTRDKIGTYYPETYTPGGTGVLYNASLMISLKTIKSWRFPEKPKNGLYLGHEVEATIIKSKVNSPWRTKKFKLLYPNPVAQEILPAADFKPMETTNATPKVQKKG